MELIGKVTLSNHIAIIGWARNHSQAGPIQVSLWMNGEKIATTLADELHQNLKNKGLHPEGKCGFIFFFSDLPANMTYPIKVTAGPQHQLLKGGTISCPPPKTYFSDTNTEKFFFVHVPKTAGSSLQKMLADQFRQEVIYPNESWRKKNRGHLYLPIFQQFAPKNLLDFQLIMGHMPMAAAELMPQPIHILSFLRHPYQRCLSRLNFESKLRLSFNPDTWESIPDKLKASLYNTQTLYFADKSKDDFLYWKNWMRMDEKALKQAKENLEACSFIGLTDRFSESIALSERTFGWRFSQAYHVLKSPQKFNLSLSEEFWRAIKNNNEYDMELYEFAVELFEKRLKNPPRHYAF